MRRRAGRSHSAGASRLPVDDGAAAASAIRAVRFSVAPRPEALSRERRAGSSWRIWRTCAASCSIR
ncbi:hypothetical protein CFB81_26230 [Burkholderia sp. AU28863]|nr:hypothetical protein CFB81_26230 [Burkholderia sp. AU28863]